MTGDPAQRRETATCSRWSIASCVPSSMPELMCMSRRSWLACWTRMVRVVRPPDSVSVIVFTAAISVLHVLEFLQHGIQPPETLRPRPLVALHPVVDGLERLAVEPVHPLASLITPLPQPYFPQHPQVLGHQRLRQADQLDEIVHRPFPAGEDVQDLPPPGLGHGAERICPRRCSRHGRIIFPYENMSTGPCGGEVRLRESDPEPGQASSPSRESQYLLQFRRHLMEHDASQDGAAVTASTAVTATTSEADDGAQSREIAVVDAGRIRCRPPRELYAAPKAVMACWRASQRWCPSRPP